MNIKIKARLFVLGLFSTVTLFANAVPKWNTFNLSLNPVQVSIVQWNATFTPGNDLNIAKSDTGLKNSAIAMAIGYCVFLELTGVQNDLKTQGADDELINKIMSCMSINQWMGTAFQESAFRTDNVSHSGFYQIDNAPFDLYQNMQYTPLKSYYSFLTYLNGGATFGPGEAQNAVVCDLDEKGFVWESVEKGYYDTVSYVRNKAPYNEIPYSDFDLAKWVVDYANNKQPTQIPYVNGQLTYNGGTLYIPDTHTFIEPYSALGIIIAYLYNRGQMPYVYYNQLPQSTMFVDVLKNNEAFEVVFNDYPEGQDAVAYGKRYIWQVPWVLTMLNQSSNVYDDIITKDDVINVLDTLKGFYSGIEYPQKGEVVHDAVVDAGISAANSSELVWNKPYNSEDTFNCIMAVTKAMLDASKTIQPK